VVLDLQQQLAAGGGAEAHADPARRGMAERIRERLLGDAQHLGIPRRVARDLVVDVELDRLLLDAGEHLDVLAQRAAETVAFEIAIAAWAARSSISSTSSSVKSGPPTFSVR